jgi:hypothetical protein
MEEDVVAWNYEKHGLYSVRSAYRLLKAAQSHEEAGRGWFVFRWPLVEEAVEVACAAKNSDFLVEGGEQFPAHKVGASSSAC